MGEEIINATDFWPGLSYSLVAMLIGTVVNYMPTRMTNSIAGAKFNFFWQEIEEFSEIAKNYGFDTSRLTRISYSSVFFI